MENHASVTGWQRLFFSQKSFPFSVAITIATFEIYGCKFTGYLIRIYKYMLFQLVLTKFFKSELFLNLLKANHMIN